jgi:hypothetical protein
MMDQMPVDLHLASTYVPAVACLARATLLILFISRLVQLRLLILFISRLVQL